MACRIRATIVCLAVGGALLAAGVASAAPLEVAPSLEFRLESVSYGYPYIANPELSAGADGTYSSVGVGQFGNLGMAWSVVVDPDPFIAGTLILTNLSPTADTFTVTGTLPASPLGGPNVMGGFLGMITFTDTSGDGAVTLSTVGATPFYQAMIDGSPVLPLGSLGSFSLPVIGGPGVFGTVSQQSFGAPIPSAPAPAVGASIGVVLKFTLSGQDKVEIPFRFEVAAASVPEPSALLLMGLALVGIAARRLKRS